MLRILMSLCAAVLCSVQALTAGPLQEVVLSTVSHVEATLVVVGPDGTETAYSPADLERMTTYSLTTATPWRDEPATFEGVLLTDILAANGMGEGVSIAVTAENNYSTVISDKVLAAVPILVATRVNGQPHNRRERGPIQFVIDQAAFEASDLTAESNFVWMAAHIQAQE